jgi:CubicO group peptidase (beta-lactamase class C family)
MLALLLGLSVLPAFPVAAATLEQPAAALDAGVALLVSRGAREAVLVAVAPGQPPRIASAIPEGSGDPLHRLFQIGSQSKWFTAAGILLLAKDGLLNLDDPVTRHLPDLPDGAGVTLRHLLNHQSGLGDGVAILEEAGRVPSGAFPFGELALLSRIRGRQFAPGTQFAYNNFGFDVLGEVIRIVSGESRAAFLRRRILLPLGMSETWFGAEESWPTARGARGFHWETGAAREMTDPGRLAWADAAGDMVSSAADMLRWLGAMQEPDNPTGLGLADFTRAAVDSSTHGPDMPNYGFGVMHRRFLGRMTWGHGGFIHGYITYAGIDTVSGTRFVALTSGAGRDAAEPGRVLTAVSEALGLALWTGDGARQ